MSKLYLYLLGALICLILAAVQIYTDRGSPTWGVVGCGAFLLASMLEME